MATYEKVNYVYIVGINGNENLKIAKIEKNKLIEISNDPELIKKLIVLFYENSMKNTDLNKLVRECLKTSKKIYIIFK